LLPLFDADQDRAVDKANVALEAIAGRYRAEWVAVMRAKLGLAGAEAGDGDLADALLAALEGQDADWTLTFRRLAGAVGGDAKGIAPLFADATALHDWLPRWQARLAPDAADRIRAANPAVIPRNHKVEEALAAATGGDMAPFEALVAVVSEPFVEREAFMLPAPQGFGRHVTFCGT
jgi:uncharacterized protein YdiU (UPF0061 family)